MVHDSLPPDPFAGDPEDPALALEALDSADDGIDEPLDDDERAGLLADLSDLAVYQALLAPRGIRGIVVDCPDCAEQHYHDWQLLRASLQQLLEAGRMRPHEPAYDPDPAGYVSLGILPRLYRRGARRKRWLSKLSHRSAAAGRRDHRTAKSRRETEGRQRDPPAGSRDPEVNSARKSRLPAEEQSWRHC